MAKPTKQKPFSITLNIAGTIYKSTGTTPQEALATLPKPDKLMTKGVLTMGGPAGKKELLQAPVNLKRLFFNSRGAQEVIAKQLFAGLK